MRATLSPFYNKLPDFATVNAGNTASIRLPNGPAYREIILKYTPDGTPANLATMVADIERVNLKINGVVRWSLSGKYIAMLQAYYAHGSFTDGELVIPLTRPWSRTPEGEENLAWGTRNVTGIHLEVKIASGATNPQLSADAWVTHESRDLGLIVEAHEIPFEAVAGGKKEIPDLPKENGSLVAVHLESPNITSLEVKLNKIPLVEDDTDLDAYQRCLNRSSGRVQQSGYVHVDALSLNRIDNAWTLAGLQEFRVNPTVSASGVIPIIMETLSQPLGPATPTK